MLFKEVAEEELAEEFLGYLAEMNHLLGTSYAGEFFGLSDDNVLRWLRGGPEDLPDKRLLEFYVKMCKEHLDGD